MECTEYVYSLSKVKCYSVVLCQLTYTSMPQWLNDVICKETVLLYMHVCVCVVCVDT